VLVGVWTPKRWDLSNSALSQFTKPKTPPPSTWIDRKKPEEKPPVKVEEDEQPLTTPAEEITDFHLQPEPPVKARSGRKPPSRRLVRHVLRSRVEAVNALAGFFDNIASNGSKKLKASAHLARIYGGHVDVAETRSRASSGSSAEVTETKAEGWRSASEVVAFLKKRGAKIPSLMQGELLDDWAAMSSEGEGYLTEEEPVWAAR
jgi:glycerol-3-phosphate O-acyltransferase/dihydroxyacetone phosphate acyltransferase